MKHPFIIISLALLLVILSASVVLNNLSRPTISYSNKSQKNADDHLTKTISQVVRLDKKAIEPTAKDFTTTKNANTQTVSKSIRELELEYSNYKPEQILAELERTNHNLSHSNLIAKANKGLLSPSERYQLSFEIKKISEENKQKFQKKR